MFSKSDWFLKVYRLVKLIQPYTKVEKKKLTNN